MWEYIGLIFATLGILAYLLKLYVERNAEFWTNHGIRTLRYDLSYFQLVTGKKNPMDFDCSLYDQLGDEKFGGIIEVGTPVLFVKDLDLAKSILVKDFDYFTDRREFGQDPVLKEALFFLQGQEWKDMRAFLSPTFTSGKIRRMFENFEKSGGRWKEYIKSGFPKAANGGHNVLVGEATKRFTVDVIGGAAFGMETDTLTNPESKFYKIVKQAATLDFKRIIRMMILMSFPKIATVFGVTMLGSEANQYFRNLLSRALKARESSSESRRDFLQLLVEAKKGDMKVDESELDSLEKEAQLRTSGEKRPKLQLTERMAIAQGCLFFLAGFDGVSTFLNTAIYVLAAEPEIQEKLYVEIERVIQTSNGKITYDGINKMEYLDMFVSEVMRLYPAIQRLERKCVKDYPIPGTDKIVPKGVLSVIPTEQIHRDEKFYPEPMKFDPERFNSENKNKRNPYAYQPFGIGPRNCIGMRFALAESKVALANLIYNFNIKPNEKTELPVKVHKMMGMFRAPEDLEVRLVSRSE